MPKTAIHLAETWIVLLAVILVCGCAPVRLEVGPYIARDNAPDRFENLVETVLAEHLRNVSTAEPAHRKRNDGSVALAGHTQTDKAAAVDGPGETVLDDAARGYASQNEVEERAPRMSPPARPPLGQQDEMRRARPTAEYAGSSDEESIIAGLDRELQLLRTERQALRHPRDELLHAAQQAKDLGAEGGDVTGNAGDQPRRQLNDLLSRLAARGLKRKTESAPPRLLPNSLRAAKPLEPTQNSFAGNESAANVTVSDSARRPIDQDDSLVKPAVPVATGPEDPFASGKALFRAGDYDGALTAFCRIDSGGLSESDRLLLRYLTATCLRKQGRWEEAQAEYTAVANSRADEVLADNARWQLGTIRWRRDLEDQVAKLRQLQQESLEENPKLEIRNSKQIQDLKSQ